MRFENYGDYLTRRWEELGFEAATEAVRQRTGVFKEDQMPWTTDQPRAEALAEEFKAVQCPIFVRIVGELHHQQGHRDVGLGRKPGGNNWQTAERACRQRHHRPEVAGRRRRPSSGSTASQFDGRSAGEAAVGGD
jgi:hypothetical protein